MPQFESIQDKLKEFFQLTQLKGRDVKSGKEVALVENCMAKIGDGKVSVKAIDITDSVFISVEMSVQKSEDGDIPIGDIDEILKVLDRFKATDVIRLVCEENKIKILRRDPLKRVTLPHVDPEYISSNAGVSKLPYRMHEGLPTAFVDGQIHLDEEGKEYNLSTKITLDSKDIKDLLSDGLAIRKLSSATYREKFILATNGSTVKAIIIGDNNRKIENELVAVVEGPDVEHTYSYGFTNIFQNLSGKADIFLAKERHMWINKITTNLSASFLIGCVTEE